MNNSFSVLFLTSWYPTPEYPTHGIFIRNHAKALSRYCNVIVLYVYSSKEIKSIELEHTQTGNLNEYVLAFPKSSIPILKNFIHLFKYYYYYYKLSHLAKKHFKNIKFAQINVIYPFGLFFPIIRKIFKINHYTIFEQWTGYLKEDNLYKGLLQKTVTKYLIKNASKTWCLCQQQKDAMIQNGLNGAYEILGNIVNTEVFKPSEKIKSDKKTFIHISTLDDRQKNISGILRTFATLEKEGYDFNLIIIGGKEDYLQNAQNITKKLGLKNISFKGILSQEELVKYYQLADALVMFSNYETFCVVIYEALSCGTYVISTDVADVKNIIQNSCGEIIPIKDEIALKNAILKVLHSNKSLCDADKAHQLIQQNFSEKVIGQKLYNYYQQLYQLS
ncbi:MAG: hypothetical protein KatS3mg027_0379 [Bacteroidia bacterium]|nr:MAG: hypothetical protein KatS3mg027_0379 [Bacteroidia bacterium]